MLESRMHREDVAAWFRPLITQLTDELGEIASELTGLRSRLESAERYPEHLEFWTSDSNTDDPLAVPRMLTALNIDPQLDGNYSHWVLLARPGTRESFGAKP